MTGSGTTTSRVASTEHELDELRCAVRDFLAAKSDEAAVRRVVDGGGFDADLWDQAARQLRLPALAIAEEFGGDGFGLVEQCAVLEEMGRALFSGPYFASAVLAANAVLLAADNAAAQRYLPALASGAATATLAVAEDDGRWSLDALTTSAASGVDGWTLTGSKSFVIDGATADTLFVVATTEAGPSLFAVDRHAPGVAVEPLRVLDPTRPLARTTFHTVAAELVGTAGAGRVIVDGVLDLAGACVAAEQAGVARRCLDQAVAYAATRHQFGRPIGSFQAVKHKCAEMLAQVELAEAATREAARRHDEEPGEFPAAAASAYLTCSRAGIFTAAENIQVHGGIGFTWEHPAHLYFRRAKSTQLLFGPTADTTERLLHRLGI
ncbi:acyl-CoA/acyl-ACP dehydrogenase [Nocardia vinacea]|uniref:Acyl-CoA/acyl-ACP dehydrogenase n=1 Tax=Nocardia vinacea TaxID=96468 RepID=A0ABZ1YUR6_9NOCA|nr:acyl-CoA dehydrogenase family protein [Nocardia vinacea]